MAYRHRVLEDRLKKHLGLFPAVAVTGPRQSGKSTLLRAALPDFPYVSFDDPEEVQAAERDPRGFLSRFPERVILDEAQRAPGLFSYLKMAIDEDRDERGGSCSRDRTSFPSPAVFPRALREGSGCSSCIPSSVGRCREPPALRRCSAAPTPS